MIYNNVLELIGKTPVLKLNNFNLENAAEVFVKLEKYNPGGSVKDRAALGMIEAAERDGLLKEGTVIVEPTSGNTGIALAMIGKLKGYKVIIVMPDTMSKERRDLITAYGAELVLTEGIKGMKGAIEKAEEMVEKHGYFMPQQFENFANSLKHYETTANEIYEDIKDLDVFVAGVGTGGTVSGIAKRLKELNPNVKVVAVEPKSSPVISGGNPGAHKIQGIGAGFVPDVLNTNIYDEIVQITNEEAFDMAKALAANESILAGISSGAAMAAALKIAERPENAGKNIAVILADTGERYLSVLAE